MLQKAVKKEDGTIEFEEDSVFEIRQQYQILHIANFCNECGNCNTFCPTNSAPYKEKPKLYLTEESFDNSKEGYWLNNDILHLKKDNIIYTLLQIENQYIFDTADAKIILNKTDFRIQNVDIKNKNFEEVNLGVASEMAVVWIGV